MMIQTDGVAIKKPFRAQYIHLSTEISSSYGMKRIHVDHEIDPQDTEKTSTHVALSY
ncbi:hypothetical protein D3C76_1673490 [compost metagenome]